MGLQLQQPPQYTDEKKSTIGNDDNKNIQDEYMKAYYAAFLKQQHELEEVAKKQLSVDTLATYDPSSSTSRRQVGMKSKCEKNDDGTEWEEAPLGGNGNVGYKVDLNVEADDVPADDDDDVDWEGDVLL
ncbi:uncharacterized protein LOC130713923 [Lotus japonicus]|uniref:uncharacterized protein LOC130713923 n=1 Tax=Lotus japonicus TaxID=34305 RepID=UPI002590DEF3|nr:uncharacterized protein LOC130713923 [Lotus japonicus]